MKINPIVYAVAGIILLVGLFFIFKPKPQVNREIPPQSKVGPQLAATPTPSTKTFELVIKDKKLVSGPETIKVTEGDWVIIKITADEPEEFHVHGYDKFVDLAKNVSGELSFTANLTGRFVFELERSKTDLGVIEVSPK